MSKTKRDQQPDTAADLSACVQALQDIIATPREAVAIAEKALAGVVMGRMGVVAASPGRVSVRIPPLPDGLAKGWAKWVFRTDPKAQGGFMFEGPFLPLGRPAALPPGAVVLYAGGSAHVVRALAFIVLDNGELCAEPLRAHRQDWKELAEAIGDYLKRARTAPLLTPHYWPAPMPLPVPAATAAAAPPPVAPPDPTEA